MIVSFFDLTLTWLNDFLLFLSDLPFAFKFNIYNNSSSRIGYRYFCLSFLSGGLTAISSFPKTLGSERHKNLRRRVDILISFKKKKKKLHYCQLYTLLNLRRHIEKEKLKSRLSSSY